MAGEIAGLMGRVSAAAMMAGRRPGEVAVLFATKSASARQIASLAPQVPHLLIGENRVQDAEEKFGGLLEILGSQKFSSIEKHMIGTLQSNKAKKAVELFDCVQSVDSIPLAEKISLAAGKAGKRMKIYIEVNNGEESKHGAPLSLAPSIAQEIRALPYLELVGLMGMGIEGDGKATREFFRKLRAAADACGLLTSMGMSDDFEIAIAEGSDMVRIGRAAFPDEK